MLGLREVSAVIALFVVLVCEQAVAAGERGFSAADKAVTVTGVRKRVSTSLIGSCSTTSFSVRLQSVKSNTTSFSRVLMYLNVTEIYASKLGNGTAKDIGICAEMADKGGFAGFSFIDGLCKMFSLGRQPCRCDAGTGDLIYVRDSFWDKQDRVIPKMVLASGDLMEYVNFPSTVFDQIQNIKGYFVEYSPISAEPDDAVMTMLLRGPGMAAVLSRGDKWFFTTAVDAEHCSMGCNTSSNFIVRELFTFKQQLVREITPRKFFLSECGNTIQINRTSLLSGKNRDILMSHEGYGCRWYTKESKDHECTVTYAVPSLNVVILLALSLDGNSSTCEGDSLAIHAGKPGIGMVVTNITSCNNRSPTLSFGEGAKEFTLVFRRSSKQHQPDGFNFGFSFVIY